MIESTLVSIFGKGNVSVSRADKAAYSTDASQIDGETGFVVWPDTKEQIRKLLSYANRFEVDIVPRGAGSGLVGGAVPKGSIVLDFSKMNRILSFDQTNKTVTVEPGVVLDDLNDFLAKYGLLFPVIPSSHKICTIGGMVACNAAGNRAVKYGNTSKWVKEIEFLDGTGKLMTFIREKDILDFCGTEGIIGVITEIKLIVTEDIKKTTVDKFIFGDPFKLVEKVKDLADDKEIIALEFFDKLISSLSGLGYNYTLIAEYESMKGDIYNKTEIDRLWNLRENAYTTIGSQGYSLIEDPILSLDSVPRLLLFLDKYNIPSFGHIGFGLIHPCFKKSQKDLIPEMYVLVKEMKGKASGEHGIGIKKIDFADDEFRSKIKELKKKHDPHNVLNRGKII